MFEEAACTWYSAEDFEDIERDVNWMLHQHQVSRASGMTDAYGDLTYCRGGLEFQDKKWMHDVSITRQEVLNAFLKEPEIQRLEGNCNTNKLDSFFESMCHHSQVKANKIGFRDSKVAQNIQRRFELNIYHLSIRRQAFRLLVPRWY